MGFKINALSKIIKTITENGGSLDNFKEALQGFKCSKNFDEENFFHNEVINYEIHNKANMLQHAISCL